MKTAKYIKKMKKWGDANLYQLSEPLEYDKPWDDEDKTPAKETSYVVVSAVIALYSGAETYIFATDKDGNVLDWGELDGSYRGGLSHDEALQRAGYSVSG